MSADNLAGGMASAAFVAYLSGLTNTAYSATQYALFSSVMLILPKFLAGFPGWLLRHSVIPDFHCNGLSGGSGADSDGAGSPCPRGFTRSTENANALK